MTYREYEPDTPPLLHTIGKYITFFAAAALCFLVPALFMAALKLLEADNRLLREAIRYLAVLIGSTSCVLLGGIQLWRGRKWTAAGAMLLAMVVFAVGMPDR